MTDAWVGLVGALGGTILGAGLTFLVARWQANRDDEQRRVAARRTAYARFHSTSEAVYQAIRHHVASDDPERAGKVGMALTELGLALGDLSAVAAVDVVERASDASHQLMVLAEHANLPGQLVKSGDPWAPGGKLDVANDAYVDAMAAYLSASRDDLRLSGWPRARRRAGAPLTPNLTPNGADDGGPRRTE